MTAEERKQNKKEKRIKKALRSYRCRFLKNLIIWFVGIISSVLVFSLALIVALKFVPVTTLTGDKTDQYVSAELADQSVLDLLLGIDSYTVDDLPVVITMLEELKNSDVMDGKKVKDFVDIDTEKLKGVKITELGNVLQDAIKVTATIDNTVGAKLLGDFGKIETLTKFKKVENSVDPTAEGFNVKLYYYDNNGKYERAFNDDKNYADGVDQSTQLYYGAITQVPITDAIDLIDETFGRIEVIELLELAGAGGAEGQTNMIEKIFAGKTISDLGSFGPENILLFDVLGGGSTDDIYTILSSATGVAYNEITFADLTEKLEINNATISTFLGEDAGDVGKILSSALNDKEYTKITIGDLTSEDFDINNVKLSIFVDESSEIATVLSSALNGKAFKEITIGDLSAKDEHNQPLLNVDSIKLEGVTDITKESTIAKILVSATTAESWGDVTLGHLTNFTPDGIVLSTVMSEDINEDSTIAKIIVEATPAERWETATVGNLSNFNPDGIVLSTVLKEEDAGDLVKILSDIFDDDYKNITVGDLNGLDICEVHLATVLPNMNETLKGILEDEYVGHEGVSSYEDITLNHLNGFDIDALHLYKVLPGDVIDINLKNILMEITGETNYNNIYVEDLHKETNILSKLTLKTVLGESDNVNNPILKKLIDDNVSVNGIAEAMDNLSLYEVYGSNVFVEITEETPAPTGALQFKENNGVYTMETTGATHYLKAGAGIWLLICFNASETIDANGRPISYAVAEDKTISSLNSGTGLTDSLINATIRQLVDAGIIAEAEVHEKIMNLKLSDVLRDPAGAIIGG